jgi:hypothetical protein
MSKKEVMRGLLLSLIVVDLVVGCSCRGTGLEGHADSSVDPGSEPAVDVTLEPDAASDPGIETRPDPEPDPECWDRDGDTYLDETCGGDDCNDLDVAIHPGAYDVCGDGIDQDCDGRDAADGVRGENLELLSYVEGGGRHFTELAWTGSEYAFIWLYVEDSVYIDWVDVIGKRVEEGRLIRDFEYAYDIAWTGSMFGTAWSACSDSSRCNLYFQTLDATGAPLIDEVQLTHSDTMLMDESTYFGPVILPDGSDFILIWLDDGSASYRILFTRVDSAGARLSEDIQVTSFTAEVEGGLNAVWTGSEVGIVWNTIEGTRPRRYQSHLTRADGSGSPLGTEVLSTSLTTHDNPAPIIWTGSEYGVFWVEPHAGTSGHDIVLSRHAPSGSEIDRAILLTTPDDMHVYEMVAMWNGTESVLLWSEFLHGFGRFYIQRLSPSGTLVEPRIELPSVFNAPDWLHMAWSGVEYGICWTDTEYRDDGLQGIHTYFNRVGFCEDE